ncbi:hypothetical protein O4159_17210 [Gordonia terrae]|nr:hypothetical protein [Gordonia terrae]
MRSALRARHRVLIVVTVGRFPTPRRCSIDLRTSIPLIEDDFGPHSATP